MKPSRSALLWALIATAIFAGFQALTVARNFGGNWTALFCTGASQRVPPELLAGTYRVRDAGGYDGQMYRYVAQDPFLAGEFHSYLDNPTLRTQRVLVPGLAWLFAFGQRNWIDSGYIAVIWLACFLGVYWTARCLEFSNLPPSRALLFLLTPATLIAADRLVIDIAAVALAAGAVWYSVSQRRNWLITVLVLAALCRETGLLLVAACVLSACLRRCWNDAFRHAAAALPTLGWYAFVHLRLRGTPEAGRAPDWLVSFQQLGPWQLFAHPSTYPFGPRLNLLVQTSDRIAILGLLLALTLAIVLWKRVPDDPVHIAALLFALSGLAVLSPIFWENVYGFSRPYSPLFILLALRGPLSGGRSWIWFLPAAMMDFRIGLQLGPQLLGIFAI